MTQDTAPADVYQDVADVRRGEPSTRAARLAEGLRALADLVEAHPHLCEEPISADWQFASINIPVWTREAVATLARAGLHSGAKVTKHVGDTYAGVDIELPGGAVSLHVYADREEICERVVVGTREVTEEVPDPDALAAVPKVTVKKIVEDVQWRCQSLLAEPAPEQVAAAALTPDAPALPDDQTSETTP